MKTKDLVMNALMIALLIIASQLSIPVQPVPITLQTLAVMLIGMLRGPKNAFIIIAGYTILGLIGLPVFSGFSGGFQTILSPSFGFILSWWLAAPLQSFYLKKREYAGYRELLISSLINSLVTSAIGIPYMAAVLNLYLGAGMGFYAVLMAGFIPFIPGDIVKIILSAVIGRQLHPKLSKNHA